MTSQASLDVGKVRSFFPGLESDQVYFDNAGGSQVLKPVIDSITTYLCRNNVQLGATYPISAKSTSLFTAGHEAGAAFINAAPHEVVIGPSTTQLFRNLSIALKVEPGSEIIISKLDHEANIASWVQLAEWKGLTVKWWVPTENTRTNPKLVPTDLEKLITPRTRLVCCTHTSNILGTITDVAALSRYIHSANPKTLFCVDAVAYAPHAGVDVKALGVDFYSFSWYKVYGPHIAMLYASEKAQNELLSLGHYFKSGDTLEEKLGLAAANYECVAAIPEIVKYISDTTWPAISRQEEDLQELVLGFLRSKPDQIKIYGEPSSDRKLRVPVISFRFKGHSSVAVIDAVESQSRFGCRSGHFYSKRLCEEVLGIEDANDGVIRCSLLHYNTAEEVRGLIKILDQIIADGVGRVSEDDYRKLTADW